MKKNLLFTMLSIAFLLQAQAQTKQKKQEPKYDTIIRRHVTKQPPKPVPVAVSKPQIVLPTPEFINQPYYYNKEDNKLTKLENASAQMMVKKKTFGLKGAKQVLSMDGASSKIRFTTKKDILFFIKTSGDVIDLTSYIKLYKFFTNDEKREVTITSREGVFNDNDEAKGKLIGFSVKTISKDNYIIQLSEQLEAGEYGFVWVKNMELKEFTVFGFGINWKSSD